MKKPLASSHGAAKTAPKIFPKTNSATLVALAFTATTGLTALSQSPAVANDTSATNFSQRGDIKNLPGPLKTRLINLVKRPHTYAPITAFSEAVGAGGQGDKPSRLFQYYLLDTKGFQSNVFTAKIPGLNDTAIQTGANAANGGLPTIGAVRVTLEPKPGLPTNPNDVRAFIDMFTDISGLFVINNESGWYEGWMIHDLKVPKIAAPHADGRARYGTMTAADAAAIKAMGSGNNVPGKLFTADGKAPVFPSASDVFPTKQGNTVPFPVSAGTFNAQQQSDVHAYWEFNPGTNWVFPHYELPSTGGVPTTFPTLQYAADFDSRIPGDGPSPLGRPANPTQTYGDNPDNPRDPDRTEATNPAQKETRLRFLPSGLTNEVILDVFVRVKSFQPAVPPTTPANIGKRLTDAYAKQVARVDKNGDGVISFVEADVDGTSDGLPNTRLYLPATAFNRFAVTREINDALLAPRFAPGQRSYVASGFLTRVNPAVPASIPLDADLR